MAGKPEQQQEPTPQEFAVLRRRRNLTVFGGIMVLALIFYIITIIRVGVF